MTPSEVKQLRRALEARQTELEEVLRDRELIAINTSADLFDQIQHATERDLAIGNLERDSSRLREVRAALARMDAGSFGSCLECEEEISPKRLAAMPWASLCLGCRQAADRRGAPLPVTLDGPLLDAS